MKDNLLQKRHGLFQFGRLRNSLFLVFCDFFSIVVAYYLALWLRFDCNVEHIPADYLRVYVHSTAYAGLLAILVYSCAHLYHRVWRFASYRELELCIIGLGGFLLCHGVLLPLVFRSMPFSYYVFGGAFQFGALLATRFGYRFLHLIFAQHRRHEENRVNAMVIGGGIAAQVIIRELQTSDKSDSIVRCVIDDDPAKQGCVIEGVRIVGGRDAILQAADEFKIQKIFFAIPSMPADERRDILNICKETHAQILALPGIYQLANEEVSVAQMREVSIADLLGRPPIQVNNDEILESLRGKIVLVTGGGGSIGSELCRQVAAHAPKQLVIFDIYENNAYDIEQELKRRFGTSLNLKVLIGSVRDTKRISQVFAACRPDVVFHAAAHKHVPLMETSPCEAIKNNVLGTYKTACAAIASGTRRFVLISTDKAVNPTNIMGASKRLCEMLVQTFDRLGAQGALNLVPNLREHTASHGDNAIGEGGLASPLPTGQRTEFVAVRFGNVLGSNGSVIPLFKKQIAEGGPVTVTSPDIIRYFMTIPEAVSLVLQAETYAKGGEICVFDMGEPMKIDTLARNLIKLSGHKPDVDIRIVYTGLRPGEKLYEERLMSEEGLRETANRLISIANPIDIDPAAFLKHLARIADAAYGNADEMKRLVSQVVDTYRPEAVA